MRLLASKSTRVCNYQFLATVGSPADFFVLSTSEFVASDLAAAKSILANAVTDNKMQRSAKPNATRFIDPSGEETGQGGFSSKPSAMIMPRGGEYSTFEEAKAQGKNGAGKSR